jgi:urea transport system substrate-binding protein
VKTLGFPPFRLDLVNQELWHLSERVPLRPKSFEVLAYLAGHAGRLVTKQELLDEVWSGVAVSDELLRGYVRELRQVLGDDATEPRFIETVSRRGYRFLPAIEIDAGEPGDVVHPSGSVLTGRDAETTVLQAALTRAIHGDRAVVFIDGEPGVGKTALLTGFLDRVQQRGEVLVASAACAQGYDAGDILVPVLHAVGTLCRGARGAEVIRALEEHAPGWLFRLPEFVPDDRVDVVEEKGRGASATRLQHELFSALAAITVATPVLLALEDTQWADAPTVELLGALARRGPKRLTVVATYRKVDAIATAHPVRALVLELHAEGLAMELSLGAFGAQDVAQYLRSRFAQHTFPVTFTRALCESTDGNPALLAKLTDRLVEQGDLQERNGRWRLRDESVPTSLAAHVNTLGPVLRARAPLRVGILHSMTGTMAWTEMPVVDATLLAIEELNQRGGIRGHRIDPVVVDGESDEAVFAHCAEDLITRERVCTIFGCWTSACRKALLPVVEGHDHLLVYPVQYEGMEQSSNVFYTGAAPNQQITPAVRWAFAFLGRRRFFLVGWDSIYSHAVNAIITDEVRSLGGDIVGEEYLLPYSTDVRRVVDQIRHADADVIMNSLVGDINVLYSRALHSVGHQPERIPTVYFSVSEIELLSLTAAETVGDYAAWNYFQSLDRAENRAFVSRFRARYGRQRVTADPMEAAYVGVHLWSQAVHAADSVEPSAIRQALPTQTFEAPEGRVTVDPATHHLSKTFRLGQIVKGGQMEIVWTSGGAIRPEPFPRSRSVDAWGALLSELFTRWGGRWTKPHVLS